MIKFAASFRRSLQLRYWRLKQRMNLVRNYFYDLRRYLASSRLWGPIEAENLDAQITMDYHRLEKGLSLKSVRLGFGADVLQRLFTAVPLYESQHGNSLATSAARAAMKEYAAYHQSLGVPATAVETFLSAHTETRSPLDIAGTLLVRREDIQAAAKSNFAKLARSRHSIRHFTGELIDRSRIEAAVSLALRTPSVCNRQTARVRCALDRDTMQKALKFQNGNRGFGDQAGAVLIVTSDMRGFTSIGERNQCWVDGGLFAMSLVYALHSDGLGTCLLNWSAERRRDLALRSALSIPAHEAVITMIAVGEMPDQLRVACSPRRNLNDILSWLDTAAPARDSAGMSPSGPA